MDLSNETGNSSEKAFYFENQSPLTSQEYSSPHLTTNNNDKTEYLQLLEFLSCERNNEPVQNISHTKFEYEPGHGHYSENSGPAKRRSHAEFERKRRDNINERFEELSNLLPDLKDGPRPNKETVLRKASQYIIYLQNSNTKIKADLAVCLQNWTWTNDVLSKANQELSDAQNQIAELKSKLSNYQNEKSKKRKSEKQSELVFISEIPSKGTLGLKTLGVFLSFFVLFSEMDFSKVDSHNYNRRLNYTQYKDLNIPFSVITTFLAFLYLIYCFIFSRRPPPTNFEDTIKVHRDTQEMLKSGEISKARDSLQHILEVSSISFLSVFFFSDLFTLKLFGYPPLKGPILYLFMLREIVIFLLIKIQLGKLFIFKRNHKYLLELVECLYEYRFEVKISRVDDHSMAQLLYLDFLLINICFELKDITETERDAYSILGHDLVIVFGKAFKIPHVLIRWFVNLFPPGSTATLVQVKAAWQMCKGEISESIATYEKAALLYKSDNRLGGWMECSMLAGWIGLSVGNFSKSYEFFKNSYEYGLKSSNKNAIWWSLLGYTCGALTEGDLNRANTLISQIDMIDLKLSSFQKSCINATKCFASVLNRDIDKSLEYIKEATVHPLRYFLPYEESWLILLIEIQLMIWEHYKNLGKPLSTIQEIANDTFKNIDRLGRVGGMIRACKIQVIYYRCRASLMNETMEVEEFLGTLKTCLEESQQMKMKILQGTVMFEMARKSTNISEETRRQSLIQASKLFEENGFPLGKQFCLHIIEHPSCDKLTAVIQSCHQLTFL